MQETPLIISTILATAILWLLTALYIYYKNHKKVNPLAQSFIILSLTLAAALPLTTIELYYPRGFPFATANLAYTILVAAGVLTLTNGLIKVYYQKINAKPLIIIVAAAVTVLKLYDYIDWVILDLPAAKPVSLTASTIIVSIVAAVIPISLKAHRRIHSDILKIKLELLVAAAAFLLTIILVITIPGNPAYPYRFQISLTLLIPFTLTGVLSVTYRHKETLQLTSITEESRGENIYEQLTAALLLKHTSKEGGCEYYDPSLKSKCRLDPSSYRLEDCKGVKYREGFICPKILKNLKERGKQ